MPLKFAKGTPLPSVMKGIPKGTQDVRLGHAIRNDNRGQWFLCESHWNVAQLERRFAEELVGGVLYERIGGLLQGPAPYIYVQIALVTRVLQQLHPNSEAEWKDVPADDQQWPEHTVERCLNEVGVSIVQHIPDIREVLATGRY
jgi:hypothetical protein